MLTVAALAAEVDLTPGALYRYFPGKDAVVAAMEGRALAAIATRFEADRERAAERARAAGLVGKAAALHALLAAADTYLTLPRELPRDFRLVAALIGDPRPLVDDRAAASVAPAFVRLLAEVAAMFAAADRARALAAGDSLERTLIYWSALHGILQIEKLRRFQPQAPGSLQMGRNAAAALLAGWGAPRRGLSVAAELLGTIPETSS